MTGEQVFLRYAWPCAKARLDTGLITQKQYRRLQSLLKNGNPTWEFLAICFPNATKELGNRRSPEEVREFWKAHRKPQNYCSVYVVEVVQIVGDFVRLAITGSFPVAVYNEYRLKLEPGNKITIHRSVAIEVL